MEGLYLYCLREKTEGAPAVSGKGIDGRGEVFTIVCGEVEAVASKVSLKEFASAEIQKKARSDLGWIKDKAVAHEKVLEGVMSQDGKILSLIPMRFGVIFIDSASLVMTLRKDYAKIKKVFDKIRGKQEWGVKVYLKDREKFEQGVKEKNEVMIAKEKAIASLPEGAAFFAEEELKETLAKEADKELSGVVAALFERLGRQAADSSQGKILASELTGRREPMVFNSAYLIPQEKIEDFKKEAEDLDQEIQAKGFSLEYSGPWPAYNFTSY